MMAIVDAIAFIIFSSSSNPFLKTYETRMEIIAATTRWACVQSEAIAEP
jgi:hypothetical protein